MSKNIIYGCLNKQILTVKDKEYQTLFNRITGSRLYGTQFEKGENPLDSEYVSDYDYRGVFIAPIEDHMSFFASVPHTIHLSVDDVEFYELKKFITMAVENNPNIMDILFGDNESLMYQTEQGKMLLDHKNEFLSQKVKDSFIGYSLAQLNRIKTHHLWVNKYPDIYQMQDMIQKSFDQKQIDFNWISDYFSGDLARHVTGEEDSNNRSLPETISFEDFIKIHKPDFNVYDYVKPHMFNYMTFYDKDNVRINSLSKEQVDFVFEKAGYEKYAGSTIHIKHNGGGLFTREGTLKSNSSPIGDQLVFIANINHSDYKKEKKKITSVWEWKIKRNEKRALLEKKFGYDTKHGMHLYRLLVSVDNLITNGEYNPRLTGDNLDIIRGIRNGEMSYQELILKSEDLKQKVTHKIITGQTSLPKEPNYKLIDKVMLDIYNYQGNTLKPKIKP